MKKILLISRNGKGRDTLLQLLEQDPASQIFTAGTEEDAANLLETDEFDLVIINSPLEGKSGVDLAVRAAENSTAAVILAVQNKYADLVSQKVEPCGVLVVGKPLVKAFFYQAIRFAEVTRHRMLSLKEENLHLQLKLAETKVVSRAKCVLIQHLSMSEDQAHKYIEKQAMDLRTSKQQVAKQILKAYEQDALIR